MAVEAMISCCMITLGEPGLARAIASARPHVDEVCVLYTGKNPDRCVPDGIDRAADWLWTDDFALARNASFALASHPFVLWLDSDDELIGGEHIPKLLAECQPNDWIALPYDYEHDLSGRCTNRHMVPRIVARSSGAWEGRVHEQYVPNTKLMVHERWDVSVRHHRTATDAARSTQRNLRILRSIEKPTQRDLFFLGMTLFDAQEYTESTHKLQRYLAGPTQDRMRAMACLRLSEMRADGGELEEANAYAFAALAAQPWIESYVNVAKVYQAAGDMQKALHFAAAGLTAKPLGQPMWSLPEVGRRAGEVVAAECAAELGDYHAAVRWGKQALENVDDEDLMASVGEWEKKVK